MGLQIYQSWGDPLAAGRDTKQETVEGDVKF